MSNATKFFCFVLLNLVYSVCCYHKSKTKITAKKKKKNNRSSKTNNNCNNNSNNSKNIS